MALAYLLYQMEFDEPLQIAMDALTKMAQRLTVLETEVKAILMAYMIDAEFYR